MTAADDANLDELKRRARRRLVGAIVLSLVVAVVVPMLLERDPKPLGEDVAVKIPPVDDGKFVSKLGEKAKADPGKAAAKSDAKAAPPSDAKADAARAEAALTDTAVKAPAPTADATPKAEPAAKADAAPKTEVPPKADASAVPTKAEPKPEAPAVVAKAEPAKAEPAKAEVAHAPAAGIPPAVANGLFAVQVYAFSDQYGANSLVNKLKARGYPAYSESTNSTKGTLWRVRIGPYASREVAATARDKLKGEGYNGIVATK